MINRGFSRVLFFWVIHKPEQGNDQVLRGDQRWKWCHETAVEQSGPEDRWVLVLPTLPRLLVISQESSIPAGQKVILQSSPHAEELSLRTSCGVSGLQGWGGMSLGIGEAPGKTEPFRNTTGCHACIISLKGNVWVLKQNANFQWVSMTKIQQLPTWS